MRPSLSGILVEMSGNSQPANATCAIMQDLDTALPLPAACIYVAIATYVAI